MERRSFLKKSVYAGISGMIIPSLSCYSSVINSGQVLYNGIRLPEIWPPADIDPDSYEPMPVPWIDSPPEVIPVDLGRQLFVDDFLIENTTLKRAFHKAVKYHGNPVLKPETKLELGDYGQPVACPKDGGVWWDPDDKIFKMWYEAGWIGTMAYATSKDGINWDRPDLDILPGTNKILPGLRPDSTTVFLDPDSPDSGQKFKMFFRGPNFLDKYNGYAMVSGDGIHWSNPIKTGYCGDRSTMFYNPFRKKWVYSIRSGGELRSGHGRARYYREHDDFLKGAEWSSKDIVFWTGADRLDPPDPVIGNNAQLYNLSAVAYESIMLGIHEIHLGPPNEVCQKQGIPKITELKLSFSRDGFHWHRPDREAFIPATRTPGSWERGYLQPAGGICTVVGDQLWFYYIGFRGDPANLNADGMKSGMYANGSTGIAVLRRDGFASMYSDEKGVLTTRPVTFNGKYLFVNCDCPNGELKVELLDDRNSVITDFSAENCLPVSEDTTCKMVRWHGSKDLSKMAGKKVRFRFHITNGHIYSFWVSPSQSGSSNGYVAGGGPGFSGSVDNAGKSHYRAAKSFLLKI
ncbi:MAG: hypothetical protein PHG29_10320 [Prolixibacteraceae bacterium]|nr:hypothetical protein [Prolixibacteraceae bacterium]